MEIHDGRRRLRPRVPGLRRRARRAGVPPAPRSSAASMRRALGIRRPWRQKVAPVVLLAIATVPAIVFVGVGYVTRNTPASDFEWITYREYVGVSSYPAGVRGPHRPRHHVPRSAPAGAPAAVRAVRSPAPTTSSPRSARCSRSSSRSRSSPRWCCSWGRSWSARMERFATRGTTPRCCGRSPLAVTVLAIYYSAIGVAISSLTSRRIIAGATIIGLLLISGIVSTVLVEGPVRPPRASRPWSRVPLRRSSPRTAG